MHKMKTRQLAAYFLAVASASTVLAGLPHYVVVPLGDVPGGDFFSRAFDINDHGMIVGSSKNLDGELIQVAVRWMPGSMEPEVLSGQEGFDFSRAGTVNNHGLIGGYRQNDGTLKRAWLWDADNGLRFIFDDSVGASRVNQVTNHGTVVGSYQFDDNGEGLHGYVLNLDTEDLLTLDPIAPDGEQALAKDSNLFDLVVGTASDTPDLPRPFKDAVTWSAGHTNANVLQGLFDFADYQETRATHVTNTGVIVGAAGNRDADDRTFAQTENWIWDPGTQSAVSLGFLEGLDWTRVGDMNDDASFLVGWAYLDGQDKPEFMENHVGAIWTPSEGWVDVNTLIADGPHGYHISELAGMNEAGEIVGTAINADGNVEAVLLRPSCLTLVVDNLVSGKNALFRVSHGTPGERTIVMAGLGGDPTTIINQNGWCATFGFDIRIKQHNIKITATGIFNEDGVFEAEKFVSDRNQGKNILFQAAEKNTCPDECMSNIVEQVVQ